MTNYMHERPSVSERLSDFRDRRPGLINGGIALGAAGLLGIGVAAGFMLDDDSNEAARAGSSSESGPDGQTTSTTITIEADGVLSEALREIGVRVVGEETEPDMTATTQESEEDRTVSTAAPMVTASSTTLSTAVQPSISHVPVVETASTTLPSTTTTPTTVATTPTTRESTTSAPTTTTTTTTSAPPACYVTATDLGTNIYAEVVNHPNVAVQWDVWSDDDPVRGVPEGNTAQDFLWGGGWVAERSEPLEYVGFSAVGCGEALIFNFDGR